MHVVFLIILYLCCDGCSPVTTVVLATRVTTDVTTLHNTEGSCGHDDVIKAWIHTVDEHCFI